MSRELASRRLPVIGTLFVGLMLSIMPLPDSIAVFRPDWLEAVAAEHGVMDAPLAEALEAYA